MNDEDIKKSLECCSTKLLSKCLECKITKNGCAEYLASQALALTNRQQAEIEQLQRNLKQCENGYSQELHLARCKIEELKSLCTSEDKLIKELRAEIKQAKSEAIKKFAAKLKCGVSITSGVITCADIDDLLAEMAGSENA